ncbi:MAG: hypothetical protein Q9M24_06690, partial [Mariprofundaceae bacterium]|nr:hypothetical protein [Mariprofundaceae bacterium]
MEDALYEVESIRRFAGYTSDEYKRGARMMGVNWCVQDKRKPKKNLSSSQRKRNRRQSSVRARFWRTVRGPHRYSEFLRVSP